VKLKEMRTEPDIQFRVNQGVNKRREQSKSSSWKIPAKTEVQIAIGLLSPDFPSAMLNLSPETNSLAWKQAGNGEITVKVY